MRLSSVGNHLSSRFHNREDKTVLFFSGCLPTSTSRLDGFYMSGSMQPCVAMGKYCQLPNFAEGTILCACLPTRSCLQTFSRRTLNAFLAPYKKTLFIFPLLSSPKHIIASRSPFSFRFFSLHGTIDTIIHDLTSRHVPSYYNRSPRRGRLCPALLLSRRHHPTHRT